MQNFGGNLEWQPAVQLAPRSEAEVLEALRAHRGRSFRVIGRLHSWSPAATTDEVQLDLRHLNGVEIHVDNEGPIATVGAGCQIKRLLHELARRGLTTPSLGLISEQTIAGATATGTHGSGKHSLSHYLCEVRIATYDEQGEPILRTIRDGDELRAARCSLGCLGVIVSVSLRPRGRYRIEEWFELHAELDEVLACEVDSPLQQFFVLPWSWNYLVQRRRETEAPRSRLAPLFRTYWFFTVDVGLHLLLRFLARVLRSPALVQGFFRHLVAWTIPRHWHVVDDSSATLIMEHELFQHIEIELFVRRSQLADALAFARELITFAGGDVAAFPPEIHNRAIDLVGTDAFDDLAGAYLHHYPICVRRVLPDDTLISMASGHEEDWYALSFISYARPSERQGFLRFADVLAATMAELFGARPHWGKWYPLDADACARLYDQLPRFREICHQADPAGLFANTWAREKLGLRSE